MGRPSQGKWVADKVQVIPGYEDCYIYKRPGSNTWQYYLSIPGEGEERKSTKVKGSPADSSVGQEEAKKVALDRKLEVMSRQKQGLKARRVKKMFDFIDEFLEEERKRIRPYNQKGFITAETFRGKRTHLASLKRFYKDKSIKLEDLDYPKLFDYPTWRLTPEPTWNPTVPKHNHSVCTELTTIRAFFGYLHRQGYISSVPSFKKVERESLRVNRRDYLNARQYAQTLNTVRAWSRRTDVTDIQSYNRKVLYEAIKIMSNSLVRIGELRQLRWSDLEPASQLSKEDQKNAHIIRIRKEITKVGEPRTLVSPTVDAFNTIRELRGIPKQPRSPWPSIPLEFRNQLIFTKARDQEQPLGTGTWNRCWQEIKELCAERYWGNKNITWYSFRHTGISFAVARNVPHLPLSKFAGTGTRYVEDVYYHHEAETQQIYDLLQQNRKFFNQSVDEEKDFLVDLESVLEDIDLK